MAKNETTTAASAAPEKTKREKFVELAERRTNKAASAIVGIGKLGNNRAYEYTQKDVDVIASALKAELDKTVKALADGLTGVRPTTNAGFKL